MKVDSTRVSCPPPPPLLNGISSHFELHAVFLDPLGGMGTRDLTRYFNSRVTRDGKFSCIARLKKDAPITPILIFCVSVSLKTYAEEKLRDIFSLLFHLSSVHISIWPKFNLSQKEMKKSKKKRGDGEVIICRGNLSQVSGSRRETEKVMNIITLPSWKSENRQIRGKYIEQTHL